MYVALLTSKPWSEHAILYSCRVNGKRKSFTGSCQESEDVYDLEIPYHQDPCVGSSKFTGSNFEVPIFMKMAWVRKARKFAPCENFPLYGTCRGEGFHYIPKLNQRYKSCDTMMM